MLGRDVEPSVAEHEISRLDPGFCRIKQRLPAMLSEADENDPSIPADWRYTTSYRQPEAVWDYENQTLSVWHEGSAVTSFPVTKGKTITIKFEVRGGKIVSPTEN